MIDQAEELEAAGLVTTGVDGQGNETWSLAPLGTRITTQLANVRGWRAAMLSNLLDASATGQ